MAACYRPPGEALGGDPGARRGGHDRSRALDATPTIQRCDVRSRTVRHEVEVIVVDGGSRDATARARRGGRSARDRERARARAPARGRRAGERAATCCCSCTPTRGSRRAGRRAVRGALADPARRRRRLPAALRPSARPRCASSNGACDCALALVRAALRRSGALRAARARSRRSAASRRRRSSRISTWCVAAQASRAPRAARRAGA